MSTIPASSSSAEAASSHTQGTPNPFNANQLRVLAAAADTVVARQTPDEVARILAHLPSDAPEWQRAAAERHAGMAYTDHPGAIDFLVEQICASFSPPNITQLGLILSLLSTRAGTLVLAGHATPFPDLTREAREQVVKNWAHSSLSDLRKLAKTFTSVPMFSLYTNSELASTAMGYHFSGDPLYEEQKDRVVQPYEYKFEEVAVDYQLFRTDVLVVGSGCGGGVVAQGLSQSGHDVLVVELGEHETHSRERSTAKHAFGHKFMGNGIFVTEAGTMSIMAAKTFGGGSTVNWSASLRPPHAVRQAWAKQYGLPHFMTTDFSDDIEYVCNRMGVSPDHIKHSKANAKLIEGSKRLNVPVDNIPQNTGGRVHNCGYCGFGCPYGEKQGGVATWLRDAVENGTKLIQRARVDRLLFADPAHSNIEPTRQNIHQMTPGGKRTKCIGALLTTLDGRKAIVHARSAVVVSGGSIQSPALLLRSGLRNKQIGRDLHLHPTTFITAFFDEDIAPHEGAIMTAVTSSTANKDGTNFGSRLEVMFSSSGLWAAAMNGWRGSAEHKQWALQYRHSASLIALTRDRDGGRVIIDANGDPRVEYTLSKYDMQSVLNGIIAGAEVMLAAGAKAIMTGQPNLQPYVAKPHHKGLADPDWLAWIAGVEKAGIQVMGSSIGSAHQMGSNRMGTKPSNSVVDPRGRYWGAQGLYVADASVLPTASGVNPMISTMSTARSITRFIDQDLKARTPLPAHL